MPTAAHDFCIWLRQFLDTRKARPLTDAETAAIRRKLSEVFVHDIDPAMGDAADQAMLNRIHGGGTH